MSIEERLHPVPRGGTGETYFVGRRPSIAAEIYVVTSARVERLQTRRGPGLDWRGSSASMMELSRVLIRRAVGQRPSRELQMRFALYVLALLPDEGFVLDSEDLLQWLSLESGPQDLVPEQISQHSWTARLRTLLPRSWHSEDSDA